MLYIFGALIAALLISIGYGGCQHKEVQRLEAGIEANKIEADRILKSAEAQGKADAIKQQKDYDEALKISDSRAKFFSGKLRDPSGKGCPSAAAASAGVPQDAATGAELSAEATGFLRGEAARADRAAIYADKCREFAIKPKPVN